MMNIDNWIYNANTNFRYRLLDGEWIKEPSSYRGQWGISKDNFGRLYVNNNSTQIQGDYVLPNTLIRNPYYKPRSAINQVLTRNQNVYPLHATSVNRGYMKGVLDEKGILKKVTAACGPLIYRGGNFPDSYSQNAFVCIPEANLIKRNILTFESTKTSAEQAWDNKEFISSTDEGFRPVNLFNGPDGAMYIVDMHRGIIQHKAFISQYLTQHLAEKKLDTLQNQGRILKVVSKENALNIVPDLSKASPKELVSFLGSANGWLRDQAQQLLIQKKVKSVKKDLYSLARKDNEYGTGIHALYVLDGLGMLSFEDLAEILNDSQNPEKIAHILRLMEFFSSVENVGRMIDIGNNILASEKPFLDLYLGISLNSWVKIAPKTFLPFLSQIAERYPDDKVIQESVVSSLGDKEELFIKNYKPNSLLREYLSQTLKNREENDLNSIFVREAGKDDGRTNGLKLFRTVCGACHGADGTGIEGLAPPLKGSEYIEGSIHRLASIILHGISGTIHVSGKLYELNGDMPASSSNSDISDRDIADITKYLQNAFAKNIKGISVEEIKKLREEKPAGGELFSEKELLERQFLR